MIRKTQDLLTTRERGDKAQCALFVRSEEVGDPNVFGTELGHEALTG